MLNKKLSAIAIASSLAFGASAASAEISGNVALTTDYKFRGISQSDESPAIQGGFDYEHESGFYVGTWGSTVDFDTNGGGLDGSLELDVYGGFASSFGDSDFGYTVGAIYYAYPGDDGQEGDYWEVNAGLSWKDLSFLVSYSDDYYAETGKFYYIQGDYSYTLPMDFVLDLHVGYNSFDDAPGFLSSTEDQYWDYSIGITKTVFGVDLTLAGVGTDLDDDDVFGYDWGDPQAIFTISKSL
jgi:uncharacterized protein (TIGR02001 family)